MSNESTIGELAGARLVEILPKHEKDVWPYLIARNVDRIIANRVSTQQAEAMESSIEKVILERKAKEYMMDRGMAEEHMEAEFQGTNLVLVKETIAIDEYKEVIVLFNDKREPQGGTMFHWKAEITHDIDTGK